ncbi:hypothetical protein V5799_003320 [Amblyomma americanum]|uniref:Secreted protein n=1 Tax=Amblyomma americanum TaxID=6943 RepID=A0AAQ4D9B1_AMBAM
MSCVSLILLSILPFAAVVEAGTMTDLMALHYRCLRVCFPYGTAPQCRPRCRCYAERGSLTAGMCFDPSIPRPQSYGPPVNSHGQVGNAGYGFRQG